MFIFCQQRQKTNQKNAAKGLCSFSARVGRKRTKRTPLKVGEGFVREKANMPRGVLCSFSVNSDRKRTKRTPLKVGEGFVREKANMPLFLALQHPLPLKYPPHLSAKADNNIYPMGKSYFCPRHGIGFASQICLGQERFLAHLKGIVTLLVLKSI